LVSLNPPYGNSKTKLKDSGDKVSVCFKPFIMGNMSNKMFAYLDFAIVFTETRFY